MRWLRKKRWRAGFVVLVVGAAMAALIGGRAFRAGRVPTATTLAMQRAHTPAGMVLVPTGDCWIGSNDADADDDTRPRRRVFVPAFYMDKWEVTNAEYVRFDSTHHFLPGQERLPATGVTYDQAAAYAKWAGKRLPTEEEWEKAARGTDGRRYPWGDVWETGRVAARVHTAPTPATKTTGQFSGLVIKETGRLCYSGPQRVQAVGSVSLGVSPYGCYDMAGNAWEWVQGFYNGDSEKRILRGGAVGYGERAHRTYERAIEGAGAT